MTESPGFWLPLRVAVSVLGYRELPEFGIATKVALKFMANDSRPCGGKTSPSGGAKDPLKVMSNRMQMSFRGIRLN